MPAYFDLLHMRTYHTGGIGGVNGKKYVFEKGQPLYVENDEDAALFRGQPEIFFEVDSQGHNVIPVVSPNESKTYKRFRAANILPEDAEDLLQKVLNEAEKAPARNVNDLLKAANEDALIPAQVEDATPKGEDLGTIVSEDLPKRPTGSAKKEKKLDPNTCTKCNRKFKSNEELEKHLADHEDRE